MKARLTRRNHVLGSVLQLAISALLLVASVGCAEQGEGERCDLNNDNADCEGSLVCTSLRSLNRGTVGAVCCPDSNPSANVCKRLSLDLDDDDDEAPTDDSAADDSAADDSAADDSAADAGDDSAADDSTASGDDATAADASASDDDATTSAPDAAASDDESDGDAASADDMISDEQTVDAASSAPSDAALLTNAEAGPDANAN